MCLRLCKNLDWHRHAMITCWSVDTQGPPRLTKQDQKFGCFVRRLSRIFLDSDDNSELCVIAVQGQTFFMKYTTCVDDKHIRQCVLYTLCVEKHRSTVCLYMSTMPTLYVCMQEGHGQLLHHCACCACANDKC